MALVEDSVPDLKLALRLREADEGAFEALYDRHAGLACAVATRILGDRQQAEDVVQECFLNVWRTAGSYDPSRTSFRTWLVTIVRNRCFDRLRSRAAQPRISPNVEIADRPAADDVASMVSRKLTAERVRQALNDLAPEQRQTLELAYYGGHTQTEIAGIMGVPLGTVKGRIRIAMNKLRQRLTGLEREDRA